MSDVVIIDSDECARAIDAALQAMNPPIEVHEGILTLIAKYAKPYARFDAGNISFFDVSANGTVATQNVKDEKLWRCICVSPSFDHGVHEAIFCVEKQTDPIGFGIVPAANLSNADTIYGCVYYSFGEYHSKDGVDAVLAEYGVGDMITVRLDLDANTVVFRKNGIGTTAGSTQNIARGYEPPFHFAFKAQTKGDAAEIVEMD